MRYTKLIVLILMYSTGMAYAELTVPPPINPGQPNNQPIDLSQPIENQAAAVAQVNQQNAQLNPLVGGGLAGGLAQETATTLSPTTGSTERKINQAQATNIGQTGQNGANAAGAALVGTGTGMIATGIATMNAALVAAGTTLVGMGGAEFAQGAATGDNNAQNGAGVDTLNNNADQGAQQTAAPNPMANFPQSLQNQLQQAGINPADLLSGAMNGSQVAEALGQPLTPDQAALADQLAAAQMPVLPATDDKMKDLTLNDGQVADGQGGKVNAGLGNNYNPSGDPTISGPKNADSNSSTARIHAQSQSDNPVAASLNLNGVDDSAIKNWLNGGGVNIPPGLDAREALVGALNQSGVLVIPKGENIFQKAHHHFKAFSKWKKGDRVASL